LADEAQGAYGAASGMADKAGRYMNKAQSAVEKGIDWAEDGVTHGADWVGAKTHGIPVVEQVAAGGARVIEGGAQLAGGALKGAAGLVGGAANMAVHPIDTVKGLAAMVGHIPIRGNEADLQYWKGVGKAISAPYAQAIHEGRPLEAVGRGVFDIGSLFIGAGEAGAAAKGGEAAGIAGRAAKVEEAAHIAGKANKIEEAANVAGKVNEAQEAAHAASPLNKGLGAEEGIRGGQNIGRASTEIEKRVHQSARNLWERPLPSEARAELEPRWQNIESGAQELRARQGDPAMAAAKERVDQLRMEASGTAQGRHGGIAGGTAEEGAMLAQENWRTADAYVRKMAESGQPLTREEIQKINHMMGQGLEHNSGVPGQIRGPGKEVMAGNNPLKAYVPGAEVSAAMDDFMKWYGAARGKVPPVELAAQAYQRLVSIHPFLDANGRTCRMVMDYILQSHGLPPATLVGKEVNAAVFGMHEMAGMDAMSADHAVRSVTQGVERTTEIMRQAQPQRRPLQPKSGMPVGVPVLKALDAGHRTQEQSQSD